jgi:hypothetical protein
MPGSLVETSSPKSDVPSIRHGYLPQIKIQNIFAKVKNGYIEPGIILHVFLPNKAARLITFFFALWVLVLKLPTQKCVPLESSGRRV